MEPSFTNNTKHMKSSVQNGTGIFVTDRKTIFTVKSQLDKIGLELQVI